MEQLEIYTTTDMRRYLPAILKQMKEDGVPVGVGPHRKPVAVLTPWGSAPVTPARPAAAPVNSRPAEDPLAEARTEAWAAALPLIADTIGYGLAVAYLQGGAITFEENQVPILRYWWAEHEHGNTNLLLSMGQVMWGTFSGTFADTEKQAPEPGYFAREVAQAMAPDSTDSARALLERAIAA